MVGLVGAVDGCAGGEFGGVECGAGGGDGGVYCDEWEVSAAGSEGW